MNRAEAHTLLKKHFGYDTFRPLQEEILESVLAKRDTLVIMPTGGGKSLCFQLPALMLPGVCLVVSPLIALMKDQVEGLRENGIAAAYINSSQSNEEQQETLAQARSGALKLLYISPEKLVSYNFIQSIAGLEIQLVAIDEAHCISMWGHDFRPEYTKLNELKHSLPGVSIIALTATADRVTQNDISRQLALHDPNKFVASFDRPNISLTVLPGKKRFEAIYSFIRKRPDESGIIYCLSRNGTEKLAAKLKAKGLSVAYYHAGMPSDQRARVQEQFLSDDIDIICATIAFGMGIDKSNVRWVIHYNLPKNIEGYYQEIGRAGRDGLASDALLFYSLADVMLLKGFIEDSGQKNILNTKLQRMQDYADATTCRRKVLLSYFNEHLEHDCGNCDVCKNPPHTFDGTVLTQKALSALIRVKDAISTNMLIDVLRGSSRHEVLERGYDQIKTWGAGADTSFDNWRHYILQMLHQGFIELVYGTYPTITVTEAGYDVLTKQRTVELVEPMEQEKFREAKEKSAKNIADLPSDDPLFDALKTLRKTIADQKGVPAYIVFSDASLREMAAVQPMTDDDFLGISGVGEKKLYEYGDTFIEKIIDHKATQL